MNRKDEAQHISNALRNVCARINILEHELYTTKNNRDELVRLKRVRKALDHDLSKLVKTIPAPLQFSFLEAVDAPRVAPAELKIESPFEEKTQGIDPLPLSVGDTSTLKR